MLNVDIHWAHTSSGEPEWDLTRVAYAYTDRWVEEILYVGKAFGATSSIGRRWDAPDKMKRFWRDLAAVRGIHHHCVLAGEIYVHDGVRLTRELLTDIETLLIIRLQPWGNVASTRTREWCRPGLVVRCLGDAWPGPRTLRDGVAHLSRPRQNLGARSLAL